MSGTNAAASTSKALTDTPDPHPGLISAVHALYHVCHRQLPAVLVTPSADEYVRVVRQVSLRGPDHLATRLLAALFLPCFMLAGLALVFIEGDPEKLASASAETWVVLLLFFSAGMMLWSTVHGHGFLREGLPFRVPAGVLWAGYGAGAVIGVAVALLGAGAALHLIAGWVAGVMIAVLIHFAVLLLWPMWGRLRLRDVYGASVPIVADRSIHDLIETRIEAAGREFVGSRPRSFGDADHYGLRRDTPPTEGPIEAAGRRLGLATWHFIGPVLGPVSRGDGRYGCWMRQARLPTRRSCRSCCAPRRDWTLRWTPRRSSREPRCCCRRMRRLRSSARAGNRADGAGRAYRPTGRSWRSPKALRSCG